MHKNRDGGSSEPTATDLEAKVRAWLIDSGYPLEMRVATAFRAIDPLLVSQGDQYVDNRTGAVRETDVSVFWMQLTEQFLHLGLHLIVECKTGTQPWVLFADPGDEHLDLVFYGLATAASAEPDDTKLVDKIHEHLAVPLTEVGDRATRRMILT